MEISRALVRQLLFHLADFVVSVTKENQPEYGDGILGRLQLGVRARLVGSVPEPPLDFVVVARQGAFLDGRSIVDPKCSDQDVELLILSHLQRGGGGTICLGAPAYTFTLTVAASVGNLSQVIWVIMPVGLFRT